MRLSFAFVLFALFATSVPTQQQEILHGCQRCTTRFIYLHWRDFFPNQLNSQAPPINDENDCFCGHADQVVACVGPCFTLNATTLHKNNRLVIGIARGCSDMLLQTIPVVEKQRKKCESETIYVYDTRPRSMLDAEWCYCDGFSCNGQPDWSSLNQDHASWKQGDGLMSVHGENVRFNNASGMKKISSSTGRILLSQSLLIMCFSGLMLLMASLSFHY